MSKFWIIFGGFICLLLLSSFAHETTHRVIFMQYGCTDIKQGMLQTDAVCADLNDAEFLSLQHAQAINEVIGYNVVPPIYLIILLMLLIKEDQK